MRLLPGHRQEAGTVKGFYLGVEVFITHWHGAWLKCRWPSGKVFTHWGEQIKATPWGEEPAWQPRRCSHARTAVTR